MSTSTLLHTLQQHQWPVLPRACCNAQHRSGPGTGQGRCREHACPIISRKGAPPTQPPPSKVGRGVWTRGEPLAEPTRPTSSTGAGSAPVPGAGQPCRAGAAAVVKGSETAWGWGWVVREGRWLVCPESQAPRCAPRHRPPWSKLSRGAASPQNL